MKQRIINTSAYIECIIRNRYTRTAIVLFIVGLCLEFFGHNYLALPFLIIGVAIYLVMNFGVHTYLMYQRAFDHMVKYKAPVEVSIYCAEVGVKVAERRFKKKYPDDFKRIEEAKRIIKDIDKPFTYVIEIHARGRNL